MIQKSHGIRVRAKSFTLPDAQVGSILEYRYTVRFEADRAFSPQWLVTAGLFQKKAVFKFTPTQRFLVFSHDRVGKGVAWTTYLPKQYQPQERDSVTSHWIELDAENIPPFVEEPHMPPLSTLQWRVDFYYRLGEKDNVESSPAVGADGTIYVGSDDDNLYAVNPDGSQKWKFTTGNVVYSSPAVGADGTIYVGSVDHNLYAVNPDGSQKWKFTTGNVVFSSPAVGADGTIYVGSDDHNLYAVNPDGSQKWKFTTGDVVFSSPAVGADGTIYVGSDDHNLYAVH